MPIWHPIEYIGEVGSAIGPLLLGLALESEATGYGARAAGIANSQ